MKVTRSLAVGVASLAVLWLAVQPTEAAAQYSSPSVRFGLSGGLALPLSDFSNTDQSGYLVSGFIQSGSRSSSLSWRAEIAYSGFNLRGAPGTDNITSFMGSVVVPLQGSVVGPYLITGIGLHHVDFVGLSTENDIGFNFGGGVRFSTGDLSTFAEVRYHYIATSGVASQMIPITFGIIF